MPNSVANKCADTHAKRRYPVLALRSTPAPISSVSATAAPRFRGTRPAPSRCGSSVREAEARQPRGEVIEVTDVDEFPQQGERFAALHRRARANAFAPDLQPRHRLGRQGAFSPDRPFPWSSSGRRGRLGYTPFPRAAQLRAARPRVSQCAACASLRPAESSRARHCSPRMPAGLLSPRVDAAISRQRRDERSSSYDRQREWASYPQRCLRQRVDELL
jgi:hypothetical protein